MEEGTGCKARGAEGCIRLRCEADVTHFFESLKVGDAVRHIDWDFWDACDHQDCIGGGGGGGMSPWFIGRGGGACRLGLLGGGGGYVCW